MKRAISILSILVILTLSLVLLTACGGDKTVDATPDTTVDVPTPTPTPDAGSDETTGDPEDTTEDMVIDPVGHDDWPAAFLLFPKYSGEGELLSSDVNENSTVMIRVFSGLTEYSIANYQDQLRKQDFVSNENADFLKYIGSAVLTWSYTVNGSNGEVTFIWKITQVEQ